jgi:hypothetical protein
MEAKQHHNQRRIWDLIQVLAATHEGSLFFEVSGKRKALMAKVGCHARNSV